MDLRLPQEWFILDPLWPHIFVSYQRVNSTKPLQERYSRRTAALFSYAATIIVGE